MKYLILLSALFIMSCSKDCDEQLEHIENQYKEALQNANGNPAAIQEITRQYKEKKANLDC